MDIADEEVNKIIRIAVSIEYHCMNILISVKCEELRKKGIISSFRIPDEYTIQYNIDRTQMT